MHNLQHGCKHDVIVHSLSVLLLQPRLQVDHIELALAMNLLSLIQYARVPAPCTCLSQSTGTAQGHYRDHAGTMQEQGQHRDNRDNNRDSSGNEDNNDNGDNKDDHMDNTENSDHRDRSERKDKNDYGHNRDNTGMTVRPGTVGDNMDARDSVNNRQ